MFILAFDDIFELLMANLLEDVGGVRTSGMSVAREINLVARIFSLLGEFRLDSIG